MKTTVIIPTKNEEESIEQVIKGISKKYEVLIVDSSTDKTAEIARKAGARVITEKKSGKGNAMVAGVKAAKGDIVVFIDGDGTYPANKIPEMVELIKNGAADVVTGSRIAGKIIDMTFMHKLGNRIFSLVASILYGKTTDLLTGLRAIKKLDFKKMNIQSTGFEIETELFIKSSKLGLKMKEIPITYTERIGDTKLSGLKDGYRILKKLISEKFKKI